MDVTMPAWQVYPAIAACVFLLQHRLMWARAILARIHPILAECAFCLGGHVGGIAWLVVSLYAGQPLVSLPQFGSLLVWVGGGASISYLFDFVTTPEDAR